MKRKAVFWTWLCAGALACAAAGDNQMSEEAKGTPNGLCLLQGLEFLSSPASEQHDALLEDGNYFLQLYYEHEFPPEWTNFTFSGSVYFQQDFVASNAVRMAKENQTPGLNQIVKADVIGMFLGFRYSPHWTNPPYCNLPLYLRANVGGEMARNADPGIDDSFNWKSDLAVGFESEIGPSTFTAEIGYGIYEMLPASEWRTICELSYMYDLSNLNMNGFLLLSSEFNGIEHSGDEQVRINVAYQMDPERLFEALAKIFVFEPRTKYAAAAAENMLPSPNIPRSNP